MSDESLQPCRELVDHWQQLSDARLHGEESLSAEDWIPTEKDVAYIATKLGVTELEAIGGYEAWAWETHLRSPCKGCTFVSARRRAPQRN